MRVDLIALAALLSLGLDAGHAALYKWVDEKGRVQYSDKPPSERELTPRQQQFHLTWSRFPVLVVTGIADCFEQLEKLRRAA